MAMESPLEVQKSIYGEDGPPMVYVPQASALHLEIRAPPPTVRACAPSKDPKRVPTNKKAMTTREIFAKVQHIKASISYQEQQVQNGAQSSSPQLSTCQLPGDFPPDLSFRSLAAYSLLRTLSVQLRLSPFTPNAFLRALALPAPNKLMGDVHVALLRILFAQKLKNMGYSYKSGGGGVGVNKKRQIDGIRWPLLAGDNLSHLDGLSWPLFYDDYCHLTADRLWESYHGPLDSEGDEGSSNQNFIDFRNIGPYIPPRGGQYKTKQHTDGLTIPISVPSGTIGNDTAKPTTVDTRNDNEQLPLHISSSVTKEEPILPPETKPVVNSDDSESEEEYQDTGEDADDDSWDDKPKKKKRRKMAKQTTSPAIAAATVTAVAQGTQLAPKVEANSSDLSHIASSAASAQVATGPTPLESVKPQNPPSDSSFSRIPSAQPSSSSPGLFPSNQLLGIPPSQAQHSSSSNQSQPSTIPPAPSQIQTNTSVNSSQEVQSVKAQVENPPSDQQQQPKQSKQEEAYKANEVEKTDDMTLANDPARIRGGGFEDNSKFTVPSNIGSNRQSLGRPRGSRMALPMCSNSITPQIPIYPAQPYHNTMLYQQHQYQFYQARSQQNLAPLHTTSQQYLSSNRNLTGTPSPYQAQKSVSNDKFNMEEESDVPFMAPDDIAKVVNDFVRGSSTYKGEEEEMENINSKSKNDDIESMDADPIFEEKLEEERWAHFRPLKAMRSGLPYHRLPMEEKVYILEFLIDELLTVDAISAEFAKRRHQEDHRPSTYGILPKEHEYQHMENKDECNVCGQEGDLLCCDGCSSSYHSYCLGMETGQNLPEGKWLCPECSIVDPSNYGSLHGGQKGSLDWFTLEEIEKSSKYQLQNYPSNSLVSSVFYPNTTTQVATTMNPYGGPIDNSQSQTHSETGNTLHGSKWKDRQFIVVHGFVFCRETAAEGRVSFEALKSSKPYLSLTKGDVEGLISETDNTLLKAWPLAQIPQATMSSSWKFPSVKQYFASKESIDPFVYRNKYYGAPLSIMTKLGSAQNMVKSMYKTFETECNKPNTAMISEVLTQDFSFDSKICASLNTRKGLFDPFKVLKGYMLKLEHTLKRSCMVNEFWEGGRFKSRGEIWISRVEEAQSIRALSRLLLKLVNAMHPKAFSPGWFHTHVGKNADINSSESERNYQALPLDWTVEKEKLKRKWEHTPSKMILSLCTDSDNELMGFASRIRSDIFIPKQRAIKKSKRKLKKAASLTEQKKIKKDVDDAAQPLNVANEENKESTKLDISQNNLPTGAHQGQNAVDQSNISNENIDSSQVPKEETIHPPLIESSGAPKTAVKKEQQEYGRNQVHSKTLKDLEVTDFTSPGLSGDVEQSALVEHSVEKAPINDAKDSANQISAESSNHFKQNEPTKDPEPPTTTDDIKEGSDVKKPESYSGKANTREKDDVHESTTKNIEAKTNSTPSETRAGETETEESTSRTDTPDKTTTTETVDPGPAKKKRKKRPKPTPRDPSTRRRTRNSDRLSSEHLVRDSAAVTKALDLEERKKFATLEGMAFQIEIAKKQKIPGLEKLLKGQYAIEGIWPIAGRRVFPTIGNISPREMRRIARNAGTAIGANLSYHTSHEVAQVSYGHIWRKRVELCDRFEELLFLMRILESSLDRDTIRQCENLTRRGKNTLQKVIRCTIRNPSTGSLDHFLVNKKSLKGCWVPGDHLDLTPLIINLFCRRQKQKEQRLERVRVKERFEREKSETERRIRMIEATKKAQEEKLRKEEARRIAKLQKQEELAKQKLAQDAKMKARLLMTQQNRKQIGPSAEINAWQNQLQLAFSSHEMRMENALRSCQDGIPPKEILLKIRQRTMEKIKIINDRLTRCNVPVMGGQQVVARMFNHEKAAAMKVKKDRDGAMSRNSQNAFSGSYPNTNNAQSISPMSGLGMNEQNRNQQHFGSGNSTVMSFNQSNRAQNMLSPEPIGNQMRSSPNNPSLPPGEFQNSFSAPRSTDMFANNQQVPLPNQQMDSMTKQNNKSRSLAPMQRAQLQPQQQHQYQQQVNLRSLPPTQGTQQQYHQQQNYSGTLAPIQPRRQQQRQNDMNFSSPMQQMQQQQPQQLERNHGAFPAQQGSQANQNRPSQPGNMNMTFNSQMTSFNGAQHQYSNQQSGQFTSPNIANHTKNGSSTNTWNNQSSFNSSQQNQTSLSRNGGNSQQNQQLQFGNSQYQLNGINYSRQSTNNNSSSQHGTHGRSNMDQMNSGPQSRNLPNQPFNSGYGHPQSTNGMNQNNAQMMYVQNQHQHQSMNYPYSTNQASQMNTNGQNSQQSMSMTPTGMQHQSFRISSAQGQPQYSQQSQSQSQQNPQGQIESMQQKLYMLQQQQRQLQQQQNQNTQFNSGSQNMQSGQFNPGSNGNNFYS